MGRLAGFSYSDVTRRLRSLGFRFDRQAKGSHEIWWNPETRNRTTVPNHPGTLPEGTLPQSCVRPTSNPTTSSKQDNRQSSKNVQDEEPLMHAIVGGRWKISEVAYAQGGGY